MGLSKAATSASPAGARGDDRYRSGRRPRVRDREADATDPDRILSVDPAALQTQQNKEVIVIEPTQAYTIYVPYYDPATVYGAWPYASYPPYYFGYPSA